jgi:hypothetical protein
VVVGAAVVTSEKTYDVEARFNAFVGGGYDPVAGPPTLETWHSLGSPSLTNIASDHGQFRMLPFGVVLFQIVLHATANAASQATTYATTLPAVYRPAFNSPFPLGFNDSQLTTDRWPRIVVTTAGAVNIGLPAITSGAVVGGSFLMVLI